MNNTLYTIAFGSSCKCTFKVFLFALFFLACEEEIPKPQELAIPPAPTLLNIYSGFVMEDYEIRYGTVKKGDTFADILTKYGLSYPDIMTFIQKSKNIFNPRNIRSGNSYRVLLSKSPPHKLEHFIYNQNPSEYIVLSALDSPQVEKCKKPVSIREKMYSGTIKQSLWETITSKSIDLKLVNKLEDIFAWTVDFHHLQKGDRFKVYLKEKYVNDTIYTGIEDIPVAFFETKKEGVFYAFEYPNEKGNKEYYDEKGNSLQGTFLKAPVKFSRISSRYSGRRFHPVLKRWKSHKGTDFAAPRGTPIFATADGVVTKSSYTSSNGKYVKVRHNSVYETQYLHMSRRTVKKNQRVKQGQMIGRIGSTGLANGHHVCYRFWKNGKQVDPFRQILPRSKTISKSRKPDYLQYINPLKRKMDGICF